MKKRIKKGRELWYRANVYTAADETAVTVRSVGPAGMDAEVELMAGMNSTKLVLSCNVAAKLGILLEEHRRKYEY